jgi:hypothetical protein
MSFYVYIYFIIFTKSIIHQNNDNAEQQNQTNYRRDLRTPGFFFEKT